jgi:hypothetical protein
LSIKVQITVPEGTVSVEGQPALARRLFDLAARGEFGPSRATVTSTVASKAGRKTQVATAALAGLLRKLIVAGRKGLSGAEAAACLGVHPKAVGHAWKTVDLPEDAVAFRRTEFGRRWMPGKGAKKALAALEKGAAKAVTIVAPKPAKAARKAKEEAPEAQPASGNASG